MRDEPSHPSGPALCSQLELRSVWSVEADSSYDSRREQKGESFLVAIRTLAGIGTLYCEGRDPFTLTPNTLLLVNNQFLRRYHPQNGCWKFWWFEFFSSASAQFPLDQVIEVKRDPTETRDFKALFTELRRLSHFDRSLATARFGVLLYRWLAQWDKRCFRSMHSSSIQSVVEAMYSKVDQCWAVSEMAQSVHMCERHFYDVFIRETGKSPKQFYNELRLREARALLSLGVCNITQVAERLRYSSPAHLCKAFKRYFKVSPSHDRPHTGEPPHSRQISRTNFIRSQGVPMDV